MSNCRVNAARPGDVAEAQLTVSQSDIDEFASVTGDDNPLHLDREYASDGPFDGTIAHGMLSAGVISSALANLPGDIVYLSQDLQFERPVYPGETVTATAEVAESLGDDRLRVRTEATIDDDPAVSGEAVVLSVAHE